MRKFVLFLSVLVLLFCMFGVAFANDDEDGEQNEVLIVNLMSTNRYNGGDGDINPSSARKLVINDSVQLVSEPDLINNVGMEKQVRDVTQKTIVPKIPEHIKHIGPKQPRQPSGLH